MRQAPFASVQLNHCREGLRQGSTGKRPIPWLGYSTSLWYGPVTCSARCATYSYAGASKSRACGGGPMTNRQLEILLVLSPMGPSAQYSGTWDFGKSKCNTGFG